MKLYSWYNNQSQYFQNEKNVEPHAQLLKPDNIYLKTNEEIKHQENNSDYSENYLVIQGS